MGKLKTNLRVGKLKQKNMKKLFTILCAVVLTLSVSAQAQFGVVAGLNSSSVGSSASEDGLEMEEGKLGMHFGGVAHIPLGDIMQLRTGAIYSQKGASDSETDDGYTTKATMNLDYLEIPIEMAFKLGDAFALSAGPYIAFAMNKSVAYDVDGPEVDPGELEFMEELVSSIIDESVGEIDFGLNFSASFTIAESFLIGTKYSMGLTDILDIPTTSIAYDPDVADEVWINGCFSISFGYMFGDSY